MKKYLKSTEVCDVLGCSLETVRAWRRKENLSAVKDGREYKFEIKKLLEWLRDSQKHDYADLLFDWITKSKPKKKTKAKKKNVEKKKIKPKPSSVKSGKKSSGRPPKNSDMSKVEIQKNAVDLFGQGFILSRIFATRAVELQDTKDPAKAARLSSLLTQLSETFRKNELARLEIDEKCGQLAPLQEVLSFIGKMGTAIKTELEAMPGALSEKLAAEDDPKKVYEILDDSVKSSLRHLTKEFRK